MNAQLKVLKDKTNLAKQNAELLEALEWLTDEADGMINRSTLLDEAIKNARKVIVKVKQ